MNREIENRILKANNISYQLAPLLKHPDIPMETKSKFINSIFVPTLAYQSQSWTVTKPLERKITTCEMRCLREAVSKTRRDMIPNTKIREMVGAGSIQHHIQRQRIKWFGYPTRQPMHHPAQRAYNTRSSGRKARGRPWKTSIKGVKETLSLYNPSTPNPPSTPCPDISTCSRQTSLSPRDAPSGISGKQK